jgi:acetyl-CoA carboxylase biotin carboxyl carrier protein
LETPQETIIIGETFKSPSTLHAHSTVSQSDALNEKSENQTEFEEKGFVVKSPFVGTFYSSSGPGEEPFVKVGMKISPDQILCIIEAMKIMNEVKSEISGQVVEVLAKDGQLIEFGAPLFRFIPCL